MGDQRARPHRDSGDRDATNRDAGGKTGDRPAPAKIRSVKKRIGEGRGNLRRRESWFRKRTSDSE